MPMPPFRAYISPDFREFQPPPLRIRQIFSLILISILTDCSDIVQRSRDRVFNTILGVLTIEHDLGRENTERMNQANREPQF